MASQADFLHGIEILEVDRQARPVRPVPTSVIGLVGTAAKGPVNTPTLILGSRSEGVAQFGDELGTIPAALDGIWDQIGATVVVVNVLDPATHKVSVAKKEYTFAADDTVKLDHRYARELEVEYGGASNDDNTGVDGTDYSYDPDTGILTRLAGGSITAKATVNVAYDRPDPTAVGAADVAGSLAGAKGVHALLQPPAGTEAVPKILCAPGFSGSVTKAGAAISGAPVLTEMVAVADKLAAVIIGEGPNTTDADAIAFRKLFGSRRVYLVDPWVRAQVGAAVSAQGFSARAAGAFARNDQDPARGWWWSPSNTVVNGVVGTARPVTFSLDDASDSANLLNANEVNTVILQDGYRLWGNRTTSGDPKFQFVNVVRINDQINQSLLRSHLWAVDRNVARSYADDVVEGVNDYLRGLVGLGAILGGRCWVDADLNTPSSIKRGQFFFDFDFTPVYPAERITFRSRLVDEYLSTLF